MQSAVSVNEKVVSNGKTAGREDTVLSERPDTNLAKLAYLFPLGSALLGLAIFLLPLSWDIQSVIYVMASLGVVIGLFHIIQFHAHLKLSDYLVTASYIEARTGIFEKRIRRIPLVYVRDVTLKQDFFQRLLGTSNIKVAATNGDAIEFENIPEGAHKQEIIWELVLAKSPDASRSRNAK